MAGHWAFAELFVKGGFILKVVACSADKDGPMVQKLGGAVLGIKWNTETDKFTIPLTVNVSHCKRGMISHHHTLSWRT